MKRVLAQVVLSVSLLTPATLNAHVSICGNISTPPYFAPLWHSANWNTFDSIAWDLMAITTGVTGPQGFSTGKADVADMNFGSVGSFTHIFVSSQLGSFPGL